MINSSLRDSVYRFGLTFYNDLKGKYTESTVYILLGMLVQCVVFEHFYSRRSIIHIYISTINPCSKYCCQCCSRSYGIYLEIFKMQNRICNFCYVWSGTSSLKNYQCRIIVSLYLCFKKKCLAIILVQIFQSHLKSMRFNCLAKRSDYFTVEI